MRFGFVRRVVIAGAWAANAAAVEGAAGAAPRLWLQFRDSPSYSSGRDVELKTLVVRRAMKSVPKEWIEYAKVEVWMSNTDLDVCALPELGDAANLPLGSDEQFVLVWEGASPAPRGGVYSATPVAQALFSDTWLEDHGKPIVLLWHQAVPVQSAVREVIGDVPLAVQMSMDRSPTFMKFSGGSDLTLVRAMGLGTWYLYHAAAKNQKHKERSFGFVMLRKVGGQVQMRFSGSKSAKLAARGELPLAKICPEIREDKRFWLDGKIYTR